MIKFRTRVRIHHTPGKIIKPNQQQTQAEFFHGVEATVIRHDAETGKGYLCVLDCPEVKAAMGETITAYFYDTELQIIAEPPHLQGVYVTHLTAEQTSGESVTIPPQSLSGPFEYADDPAITPRGKTTLSIHKK